ncbi:MAG: hypothetical protein C0483_17085 [Pirellula sp.]|nr:hypothetical protein [Pirellula sp.]
MKRWKCSARLLPAIVAATGITIGGALAAEPPGPSNLGKIDGYSLRDTAGIPRTAKDWSDRKGVVYCFLGVECPVSNGYAPQMQRLAEKFAPQEVALVGVYSELDATRQKTAAHGEEYGLKFPCLLDTEQSLARQAGIRRVLTVIVVDPEGNIVYRGRIDDRWSPEGKRRDVPRTHELEDAVAALLAGEAPAARETPAFGCPLVFAKPAAAP